MHWFLLRLRFASTEFKEMEELNLSVSLNDLPVLFLQWFYDVRVPGALYIKDASPEQSAPYTDQLTTHVKASISCV